MTPAPQPTLSAQVQRVAADISARLAQIAKDPPDLAVYFKLHGETISHALQPVGFAYEMATGQSFQRTFAHNYDSLDLRDAPAQELAFQRAIKAVAEQGKPVFLDANTAPPDGLRGLSVEDAPAPESLPVHNRTAFQQIFVPIPLGKKSVGVLHAWFTPADAASAQGRIAILSRAAADIELYLKARRISDISQELARINTYARFLEDVAGDQDLESVSWKLVNYAREAVGCDRVCLLVDLRYGLAATRDLPLSDRLSLQACSGLRRPNARSEHADVLRDHASELLKMAVGVTAPSAPDTPAKDPAADERTAPAPNEPKPAPAQVATAKQTAESAGGEKRPQMRIIFTHRDPAKSAGRPDAVNRYFEVIPMNWSTVLPLYDRDNRVCGTLLFEGQQSNDKMGALFTQMRDLAVSGGRALSTALVWQRRRTLRGARILMRWRDRMLATPRRQLFLKYGVPTIALIGLLAFPFPYRIRGEATLRPVKVQSVAALTSGRLMEVSARSGDRVTKDQLICVLDDADLRLQYQQAIQEKDRAETQASYARFQERNDVLMRSWQLTAEKAATAAEKHLRDIELTRIRAPFDGILVGPQDLGQRSGQVIRLGETVAEVVDPSRWEVQVSVREQDVPDLVAEVKRARDGGSETGVPGELVLTASPNDIMPLHLADPSGFAHRLTTEGGKYNFSAVVPLDLTAPDSAQLTAGPALKMGYTGRVRFTCGRRPLASILFGDFVRFMKLTFF